MNLSNDKFYSQFLRKIQNKYQVAQIKAAYSVNQELIHFYWDLGNEIIKTQQDYAWGSKFLDSLSLDLQKMFPEAQGFSVRNLKFMRQFAEAYPEIEFRKHSVSQIPWGHIILLLQKVKDNDIREWYIKNTIENGISRSILTMQIEQNLYARQAGQSSKVSNFISNLSKSQSDLAVEMLKNPYNFDFLTIGSDAKEKDIENALVSHISKFLVELGSGFAFMGNQYKITVSGDDYFVDMLFYHVKLRCYVVIELKAGKFKPEHAGQMNFYLSAVDDALKTENDNPSIGILLCKERDHIKAEYALRRSNSPIGISEYELIRQLPKQLKSDLPTIDEIESGLRASEELA